MSIFALLNQQLIIFSQYFFNRFKSVRLPHIANRDSLTLIGDALLLGRYCIALRRLAFEKRVYRNNFF